MPSDWATGTLSCGAAPQEVWLSNHAPGPFFDEGSSLHHARNEDAPGATQPGLPRQFPDGGIEPPISGGHATTGSSARTVQTPARYLRERAEIMGSHEKSQAISNISATRLSMRCFWAPWMRDRVTW